MGPYPGVFFDSPVVSPIPSDLLYKRENKSRPQSETVDFGRPSGRGPICIKVSEEVSLGWCLDSTTSFSFQPLLPYCRRLKVDLREIGSSLQSISSYDVILTYWMLERVLVILPRSHRIGCLLP